jgi:hypothetical protein
MAIPTTILDLALDNTTNDLLLDNGNLIFISNLDFVRQNLKVRLQWFLGEWFLNVSLGLPYFTDILTKNPNQTAVAAFFKKVILQSYGITSLDSFSFDIINIQQRIVKVTFKAITSYGIINYSEELTT